MPGRVIHFGTDDCHRLMVLESAGYALKECDCLVELRRLLEDSVRTDALVVSEGDGVSLQEVVAVARTHSCLPVILFRNTNLEYEDDGVDLVIYCLTPPRVWLNEVEAAIEKTRDSLHA